MASGKAHGLQVLYSAWLTQRPGVVCRFKKFSQNSSVLVD